MTMLATTITFARFYAELGWRVIPIEPGKKYPAGFTAWQDVATTDLGQIEEWWGGTYANYGIGVATGAESGIFIIDIDHAEGRAVAARWEAEYGPLPTTVQARSGSGDGHHLVFRHPGRKVRTRRGTDTSDVIPKGIDVRGDGGQFVAAPTRHPSGGLYEWAAGFEPWSDTPIADAPDWLLAIVLDDVPAPPAPPPAAPSMPARTGIPLHGPAPSTTFAADEGPAEWYNRTTDFAALLVQHGWTPMHQHGSEWYWCRPGKDPRNGHSAVLHLDVPQVLVVFSVSAPVELMQRQYETGRGDGWRFDAFEFYAAMHHGGSKADAGRAVRGMMPRHPSAFIAPQRALYGPVAGAAAPDDAQARPILDDEFWNAREALTLIRRAAHARYAAPAALLAAVLARTASLTPPSVVIPGDFGEVSPLSMYVAIYGPSGTGKSLVGRLATQLIPVTPPWCAGPLALGSGEGLVEAYMELVEEQTVGPDGKKRTTKVKRQMKRGVLFMLDEGQALGEVANRKGSTIMSVLRTAWSGHDPGQANASVETRRHLAPGSYTLGLISGWQDDAAMQLLDDHVGGTPQRFLWAAAQDPSIPRGGVGADRSIRPLAWEPPPSVAHEGVIMASPIELAPMAAAETEALRYGVATGTAAVAALDSHRNLLRLRVAGLLAVLDGRHRQMTDDDWRLAGLVLDNSDAVRNWIVRLADERRRSKRVARAQGEAEVVLEVENAKAAAALDRAARAVYRAVQRGGGTTTNKAVHERMSGELRKVVPVVEAVAEAERRGWVVIDANGAIAAGPSQPSS